MSKIPDDELQVELEALVGRLGEFLNRHGNTKEAADRVMDILCNGTFNILLCLNIPLQEYLTSFAAMFEQMISKLVAQQVNEIVAAPAKEAANADQG